MACYNAMTYVRHQAEEDMRGRFRMYQKQASPFISKNKKLPYSNAVNKNILLINKEVTEDTSHSILSY